MTVTISFIIAVISWCINNEKDRKTIREMKRVDIYAEALRSVAKLNYGDKEMKMIFYNNLHACYVYGSKGTIKAINKLADIASKKMVDQQDEAIREIIKHMRKDVGLGKIAKDDMHFFNTDDSKSENINQQGNSDTPPPVPGV